MIPYLLSVPEQHRLEVLGLSGGRWQAYRTVASMVAVITAVLAGSAAGLLAAIISLYSLTAALAAGGTAAAVTLAVLMRRQASVWKRSVSIPIITDQDGEASASAPNSS